MQRPASTLARSARVSFGIEPTRVNGSWASGPAKVGIVLDGVVQAIVDTRADGFAWDVPAHVFGRLLDVVSIESGASLLDAPAAFDAVRGVRWRGWVLQQLRVSGSFEADGPAAALPIALVSDGRRYAEGFARREDGGEFAFEIEIHRLPPGIEGVALQPVVGGLLLTPVLLVPADAFGHVGFLEPSEPWRVRGWAVERGRFGAPVALDMYVDGRLATTLVTDKPREDVGASGFGDGLAGFDVAVPAPLDRVVTIDVRVAGGGPSLGASPFVRPAAPRYVGYLDGVDGLSAGGWAIDLAELERPVGVQALCDGEVVGAGLADLYRGDVAEAGLPVGRCGFHLVLTRPASWLAGREVVVTIAGTGLALQGSPRTVALNRNVAAFLERKRPAPPVLARLRRRLTRRVRDVLISIVMPVHETRREWLAEAIGSVTGQWSDNWELICVDDGSMGTHVQEVLQAAAGDGRVRVVRRERSGGIARAVNAGLRVARGQYVAFLDHDDALEPDAVYHLARAVQATQAGLIYSDEVLTGPSLDQVVQHRARPAWSHDYYLSHPYFVHLVAVRRTLALAVGGYDETMAISADVDFVLRVAERADVIAHVPLVLYRWRTHDQSAGHKRRDQVMPATQEAIGRHLERLGRAAAVRAGLGFNQFRVDWPDDGGEVLIVIPTKDRADLLRRCIDSIAATAAGEQYRIVVVDHQSTDPASVAYLDGLPHVVLPYAGPFNFAAMNNWAIRSQGREASYLLFLNNDVEAVEPGWLARLRSLAGRPEIGAVGPLLVYGNGRVQHAGVIVGFGGIADHAMRFAEPIAPDGSRAAGYNSSLTSVRDFSAVTAACLMMRRAAFDQAGGFDETFAVGFNDTDLCLRLRAAGLRVLYDGHTVLRHHESATRSEDKALADPTGDEARFRARWAQALDGVDPFYNPWLSTHGFDHRLRTDPALREQLMPRAMGEAGVQAGAIL